MEFPAEKVSVTYYRFLRESQRPVAIVRHWNHSTVQSNKVSSLSRAVDGTLPGLPRLELVEDPVVHLRLALLDAIATTGGLKLSNVFPNHLIPTIAEDLLCCVVAPDDLK